MAISPDIENGPFTGNGTQVAFPFTFTAITPAEVAVLLDGVVQSAGYTVALAESGGTVTFGTPPAVGAQIVLRSSPDFLQDSVFENEGAYNLATVNTVNRRHAVRALVTKKRLDATSVAAADASAGAAAASAAAAAGAVSAAAGSAGAAAGSAGAAGASAASAAGSASAAAGSVSGAALAAATAGAYPNSAATNVPRGLTQASVGAITGGSGGTNGTFALSWSGGNFDTNPTGTFTVSGGALTAVTITGPGLRIGATATVPTPSFAASAGLTGAAVALTAQFLVANGLGYWVQSADNAQLLRYANVGGVATAVSGVGPVPLTFPALPIVAPYAKAAKAAVGTGSLKLLVDMDGPRTAYSGSATIMTAMTSIDDSAITLGMNGVIFSGTDPRPVYNSRGIYMSSQAGFETTAPILSKTSGDFAIIAAYDLNTVTSQVATQSVLPGSPVEGDMVQVTADTNMNVSPDVKTVLDQPFPDNLLVNGYFKRNAGFAVWEVGVYTLFKASGPSGSFISALLSHLGQLNVAVYTPAAGAVTVFSKGAVLLGNGTLTIAIRRKGPDLFLIVNGQTLHGMAGTDGTSATFPNITDLNKWYFNGNDRYSGAVQPILSGVRHYWKGMAVADDLTEAAFRDLHDTFAHRHGTAPLSRPPKARGMVMMGQSQLQATSVVTDTWLHGPNFWNGMIAKNNATYSGEGNTVTREAFPGVYCSADLDRPGDIAPYSHDINYFGTIAGGHAFGQTGEGVVPGMFKRILMHPKGRETDWIISGAGIGAASLATLAYQSVVPLVEQLKTIPLAANDYYNKVIRQVVYANDFAIANGQTYSVDVFYWLQGGSDQFNVNYVTDLYALYDRFCAHVKQITGQSHNPRFFCPQFNYSSDGVKNDGIANGVSIDQKFLDMEDNRGTRPMFCTGPIYQIANFNHLYRAGYRWFGERDGDTIARVMFDGESYSCMRPYSFTIGSGSGEFWIDIKYRVRTGRALTLGCTNNNNILSVATNQGYETVGTGTALNIASVGLHPTSPTDTIRVKTNRLAVAASGDLIRYTGATNRVGNVADGATKVAGNYRDQLWSATYVSNSPYFTDGATTDLRQWSVAFTKVL